jgi:Holliday junction resolvasome RuvABC endonuclease subunit
VELRQMNILALDAATKTGWALIKDGRVLESGVQDFSKRRGESNGAMFFRFRNWLCNVLIVGQVAFVAYELSHFRGGAATEIGVNLTGRIQEECAARGIEYAAVHTATLKKWATGRGNAEKGQMVSRAGEILGRSPEDDNEADAVLCGMHAWEMYGRKG